MYQTEIDGKHYELGTSGFLYQSNKLMYDRETSSLWSTFRGRPVFGTLYEQGLKGNPLELTALQVVTTTWAQWRELHPESTVVSLNTGHDRDYGEGVAYNAYFSSDELMFKTPRMDDRLLNKSEVFALRFTGDDKVALSAGFLSDNPLYQQSRSGVDFVIVTDTSGANRAFDSGGREFSFADDSNRTTIVDANGNRFEITESGLVGDDVTLKRLPAHRAFWFGWFNAFPETELIQ